MKISLIICTRNRFEKLCCCLAHVKRLKCDRDWELVIVDNGSSDGTADLARQFGKQVDFPVKLVVEPIPGLGRARNAGIAHATGEILAFTDDDCYPDPDCLGQTLKVFEDPEIGFMGGRVMLYDPSDAPITIRTDMTVTFIPPGSFIPAGLIQGANMAVRRTVTDAIGGFDSMLGAGTGFLIEDVDFVARASAAGWKGGYFPGPVVHHHHGRKPGKAMDDLVKRYAFGVGAYYAKFILNRQTWMLYAKNWWWGMTWRNKERVACELFGAFHYCMRRFLQLFKYERSRADSFNRPVHHSSIPVNRER